MADKAMPPVSLKDISLRTSHFEMLSDDGTHGGTLDMKVRLELKLGDAGLADGYCHLSLTGCEAASETPSFKLELSIRARYQIEDEADWSEEQRKQFVKRNVMMHVWPYAREHAHQISSKAGLPPVVLPLLPMGSADSSTDHED